jgi:hypothetical protein
MKRLFAMAAFLLFVGGTNPKGQMKPPVAEIDTTEHFNESMDKLSATFQKLEKSVRKSKPTRP